MDEREKQLLDIAKRGVEMALEKSEDVAETMINKQVQTLSVNV